MRPTCYHFPHPAGLVARLNPVYVMPPPPITVETDGGHDSGPCECCGNMSRIVWGWLGEGDVTIAAYSVHWTLGRVDDHGANFDLIVGKWGDDSRPEDRFVVAVALRWMPGGPQFMVIDADGRPAALAKDVAATAKRRDEVIGTPLAPRVFAMLDAIWLGDSRIGEVTGHVA